MFNLFKKKTEKINIDENEVNKAKFENDGLEFSIVGKYYEQENYNDVKGFHYAFLIESKEMIYKPEDYDDVCDYESSGFRINIAYFENFPFNECEKGIVLKSKLKDLKKTIKINPSNEYIFEIDTVETDEIDYGEITVLESNGDELTISFKFVVKAGLCDTVSGIVKLSKDTENYD